MKILTLRKTLLPSLRHLLAPPRCETCIEEVPHPPALCPTCQRGLLLLSPNHCEICALPFEGETNTPHCCQACLKRTPAFKKVTAVFEFEGTAEALLHAIKFGKRLTAIELFVKGGKTKFAQVVKDFKPDFLVPVPLSWRRGFFRGFNQSHLLAQGLQKYSGTSIPFFDKIKRRHHEPQAKKGRRERLKSLRGVFRIPPSEGLKKSRVLIVDDVVTTGATVEALSLALLRSGVSGVQVFSLARVRRKVG